VIVCDTGPLVAAALTNDDDHVPCVELLTGMHLAGRPLLVPGPVVAEVGYLLKREAGPLVEALFLRSLGEGDLQPVDLRPADYVRMARLCAAIVDRLTFGGNIIETGTVCYRLAHTRAQRAG
jgi:predicted nucleic acid-binding protein